MELLDIKGRINRRTLEIIGRPPSESLEVARESLHQLLTRTWIGGFLFGVIFTIIIYVSNF